MAARFVLVPFALALVGLAALAIDVPTARWFAENSLPRTLHKLVILSEAFGHGLGAATILLVVWTLDSEHRRRVVRLGLASLGAGAASNVGKLLLARERPRFFSGDDVWSSFGSWFPLFSGGSAMQGTPSSHTATAVGLAVGLSWAYPRGRYLFFALAALAGLQRVVASDHFVSDTFWGAAAGWFLAELCLRGTRLSRRLDAFEGAAATKTPAISPRRAA